MPTVNNTPRLSTKNPVAQSDALSSPETSSSTTAYTQNKHGDPTPSTSTNLTLYARNIKKDFIFNEKYKTLLECISKGKNSEINTLLINHIKGIDKLVSSCNVSFSSAHQQFILSLSNNIPEDLQDKDLNICINNINNLLNKILFFTQKIVEIISCNKNKIKQYVSTSTVIQPIWLFQTKTIVNAKSLLDLSEEQIIQLANEPNIDKIISKKFIGQGFNIILSSMVGNNNKNSNATRKRDSSMLDNPYRADKKIKLDNKKSQKIELVRKSKLLINEHIEKIEKFCHNKEIIFSKSHKNFVGFYYNKLSRSLFDDQKNYLLDTLLDKLYLIITESNKYNTATSTFSFIYPVCSSNSPRHLKSILDIPDELIKDPSFNQSLFRLLTTYKYTNLGYPSVDEILAAKTSD